MLSVTSKVFSRIILERISAVIDPLMRKEQTGFRKGRSCGDHNVYIAADHGTAPGMEHAGLCNLC